jgi:hypothetical protein
MLPVDHRHFLPRPLLLLLLLLLLLMLTILLTLLSRSYSNKSTFYAHCLDTSHHNYLAVVAAQQQSRCAAILQVFGFGTLWCIFGTHRPRPAAAKFSTRPHPIFVFL